MKDCQNIDYDKPDRVETGVVRFGEDDWPGVFIRGDNCFYYAAALAEMLNNDMPCAITRGIVLDLQKLLESSRM